MLTNLRPGESCLLSDRVATPTAPSSERPRSCFSLHCLRARLLIHQTSKPTTNKHKTPPTTLPAMMPPVVFSSSWLAEAAVIIGARERRRVDLKEGMKGPNECRTSERV